MQVICLSFAAACEEFEIFSIIFGLGLGLWAVACGPSEISQIIGVNRGRADKSPCLRLKFNFTHN